jgi:malate dehydrogenase (oxaloacetate-decarboxylating)(NADP+)
MESVALNPPLITKKKLGRLGNDNKMVRFTNRAKIEPKRIVFAEADHLDVFKAAQIAYEEGICHPILLGSKEIILEPKKSWFYAELEIIDPKIKEEDARRFANYLLGI